MRLPSARWSFWSSTSSSKLSSGSTYARVRFHSTGKHQSDPAGWETVIGLEIHAQIKTDRKLFSRATFQYADLANTNVDLLDVAIPGSLPVLNKDAVRLAVMTAMALKCDINPHSTFDRKHYFYHDIPSSYQITQHYNALAKNGTLPIYKGENGADRNVDIRIQQLQIEQDTAKSQVVGDNRLVDLNRAGSGLMEIVTEPDMKSPEEAGAFVRKLQSLLRRVGSGDGDMEKGNLRIDANVSVHRQGTAYGIRCEIKNLNSVRYLQQAIRSEMRRHIEHYETSPSVPLERETRGLNEVTGETYSLRSKGDAMDYRYMPDSNLPAMVIDEGYTAKLRGTLPELPWETVSRLTETYGVAARDVETLLGLDEFNAAGVKYFEEVVDSDVKIGKRALNLIAHELLGQLYKSDRSWSPDLVPASLMREMVTSIEDGTISGKTGKAVLTHILSLPPSSPSDTKLNSILEELNLLPSKADDADLRKVCEDVVVALPDVVKAIQAGQERPIGRLIGEVMKRSGGKADPKKARELLLSLISSKA